MPLFIYKGYIHRLIIMKEYNIRVRLLFIHIFVVFALLLFATVAYAENPIMSLREETPVDEINYLPMTVLSLYIAVLDLEKQKKLIP
ncbi:MAG: hypothetical protein GX957_12715 [Clostridiaceae bacterium]|nr:hypothetical protein [Clostridiaceae bacterium]